MRKIILTLALTLAPFAASAADKPVWAFPVTDKTQPPSNEDPNRLRTSPNSEMKLTKAQIDNLFGPPDWRPEMHPPMADVVAHGRPPNVRACGSCHLPTGTGHDESAYIAGQPIEYFVRQMRDFKSGARTGAASMQTIAKDITDDEILSAAKYFASVKPLQWVRVVETDEVPKTYISPGNKRLALPDGGVEPIGQRIIEIPEDENLVLNRDPLKGFVAYVPKGALAKGEALAKGVEGKTIACAICHGPDLRGLADIPPLAGRTPNYLVRQLFMIQDGERAGPQSPLMAQVVSKLSVEDMLDLAAYASSLAP